MSNFGYKLVNLKRSIKTTNTITIYVHGFLNENLKIENYDTLEKSLNKHLDFDEDLFLFKWNSGMHPFYFKDTAFNELKKEYFKKNMRTFSYQQPTTNSIFFKILESVFVAAGSIENYLKDTWKLLKKAIPMYAKFLAYEIYKIYSSNKRINLLGHSLGAEIIKETALVLKRKYNISVNNLLFFGGASPLNCEKWGKLDHICKEGLYNFYSIVDLPLNFLYTHLEESRPIGIDKINVNSRKTKNIEVTGDVMGHTRYVDNLDYLLKEYYKK